MKQIIKNLVDKKFIPGNGIVSVNFEKDFEHFCNYTILKKEFNNTFDIIDVSTGKNFQGIDGIAVIVNNTYIENIQQLQDIIEEQKNIKVNFVFIQSKTSDSFNSGEILNFTNSVKDFFSDNPKLVIQKRLKVN